MDDAAPGYRYKRYYDQLCGCHKNSEGHPPPLIPLSHITEAVENGCSICSIVKHGLSTILNGAIDPEYGVTFAIKPHGEFKVNYMKDEEWQTRKKFEIYLGIKQQALNEPLDNMANFREVFQDPMSDDGKERMKELLTYCVNSHPQCRPPSEACLPTRVIDIGDQDMNPRLYLSRNEKQAYAALSHCWGSSQLLTTTRATVSTRQNGIDWQSLPKTFQDAFKICHTLGLRYLWIDSLCIVQDDRQDWEVESAKMGDIYHNSFITIAASASSESRAGFLSTRKDHISKDFSVSHPIFPKGLARFKVRVALGKHKRHDIPAKIRDPWRTNLIGPGGTMEPLDYRSWAFQERLVSRRLLSFCSKEIEWDCLRCCDCECGARFSSFWTDGWDFRNASARQTYQGLIDTAEGLIDEEDTEGFGKWQKHIYQQWRMTIVPSYTQLRLTKETDRLVALSAVAQGLEGILNDTYLCGHWRAELEVSLAWSSGAYGTNPPSPGRLPERYRAPSWSWPSIEGPIDACFDYEDDYESICNVLDASITAATQNPRADARDGFVTVSGYLLSGMMTETIVQVDGSPLSAAFYPDSSFERRNSTVQRSMSVERDQALRGSTPVCLLAILIARPRSNIGFMDKDDEEISETSDLQAKRWITFLVLTPSESRPEAFGRLGIFKKVDSTSLPNEWYKTWPKREVVLV